MRPRSIEEYGGQKHLVGEGAPLRRAIQAGKPHSMILWGPPGVGKMTVVRRFLERAAADRPVPDDWCYVHNFDDAVRPRALPMPGAPRCSWPSSRSPSPITIRPRIGTVSITSRMASGAVYQSPLGAPLK